MRHQGSGPWSFEVFCLAAISCLAGCNSANQQSDFDLTTWLGESVNSTEFAQVDGSHRITFPRDHGPHDNFMTEWWYITSVLETEAGKEFGVQFTVFRRALAPDMEKRDSWSTGQVYMAHVALSDVSKRRHYDEERLSRGHEMLAGASDSPFRAFVENWSVASTSSEFFPLALQAQAESFIIDLTLTQTKPIVLQGKDGYSVKSPEHASYYYSIPRMATTGSLTVGKESYEVAGFSWMDREWSSGLLGRQYQGWYWFALSLSDGRDLILFSLRDRDIGDDSHRVAQWIEADGSTNPIERESWSAKPVRHWKQWPVEWELTIGDTLLVVSAKFDNQEMNTQIPYWEGLVEVKEGAASTGSGYMELTGY